MATVYLARHEVIGIDVALKVLREAPVKDPRRVVRFAREARAASRIDHENVVAVLDFGWAEEGFYYLVMERVSGMPLSDDIARRAPFPAGRTVHVLAQIAAAIGRAHELDIVHRDLKTENVMLCRRGTDADFVKVLDFGLARAIQALPGMPKVTVAGEVFGTPECMAPEQWETADVDGRADIYALGVIGYEMVTGRAPFRGGLVEVIRQHLQDAPLRPSEVVPGVEIPRVLEATIMTCLEKDPSARFQTVADLLSILGKVWESVPSPARRTTYSRTRSAISLGPAATHEPTIAEVRGASPSWDGPAVAEELRALHGQWTRKVGEIADLLWGESPPQALASLRFEISEIERRIDRECAEIALLAARMDDVARADREQDALLRLQMIEASLAVSRLLDRLPHAATVPHLSRSKPDDATVSARKDSPEAHLLRAEVQLAAFGRDRLRRELETEARIGDHIRTLRLLETGLVPRHQALADAVAEHCRSGPEFAARLANLAALRTAISSYEALLTALAGGGAISPPPDEDTLPGVSLP